MSVRHCIVLQDCGGMQKNSSEVPSILFTLSLRHMLMIYVLKYIDTNILELLLIAIPRLSRFRFIFTLV